MLVSNDKTISTDEKFESDQYDARYSNYVFVRLNAYGRKFANVDFRYTTFDSCYLRNVKFDSCDFTGCRFLAANLHGARFSGCRFEYATFERTLIDASILDTEYPKQENLRMRFARALRINFQQIGDVTSANKAIRMELEATGTHLYKACLSSQPYYRNKYSGLLWWKFLYWWIVFGLGDFVWGNGESLSRLLRCTLLILFVMTFYDIFNFGDAHIVGDYWTAFLRSCETFMGVGVEGATYPKPYLTIITLVRLVSIGFLLSIIIKKFNRR